MSQKVTGEANLVLCNCTQRLICSPTRTFGLCGEFRYSCNHIYLIFEFHNRAAEVNQAQMDRITSRLHARALLRHLCRQEGNLPPESARAFRETLEGQHKGAIT